MVIMADIRESLPTSVLRQLKDEGYHIVKFVDYEPDFSAGLQGDDMSQADNAILIGMREQIDALTARIGALEEHAAGVLRREEERLNGKDLNPELYGEQPDHVAARASVKAAVARR